MASSSPSDTSLIDEYVEVLNELADISAAENKAKRRKADIEAKLKAFARDNKMEKFGDERITVSVVDELQAGYDPDRWPEFVEWMAKTGNTGLVQRRLSNKKICDLAETDGIPEFLKIESVTKVKHRRN